jgi:hypothetical protein
LGSSRASRGQDRTSPNKVVESELIGAPTEEASMVDFTGSWRNQHGSMLELRQLGGGAVDGRFESGVGDDGQTKWVEVSGRAQGDLITFHAAYPEYSTLVTWIGQHTEENGVGLLNTHWLHVSDIPDAQEQQWMWFSNRIGFDVFRRV